MGEKQASKGTVTAMSSLYPTEDAEKAAKRVQDTISQKQRELGHLQSFISDNTNLINLVQRLPDHLHHDIMVTPENENKKTKKTKNKNPSFLLNKKELNFVLLLFFWGVRRFRLGRRRFFLGV